MMPASGPRPGQVAVQVSLAAVFVSLELSRSTWLITSLVPGGGDKMSKHLVRSGDVAELMVPHPSNNLAKLPFDFSVRVPRTQLRPRYGDGFDGAPLTGRRPRGEGRAGGGGADDPARSANPASAGAGESRDHPVQQPMACRSFRAVASASGAPLGAACRALDRAQE